MDQFLCAYFKQGEFFLYYLSLCCLTWGHICTTMSYLLLFLQEIWLNFKLSQKIIINFQSVDFYSTDKCLASNHLHMQMVCYKSVNYIFIQVCFFYIILTLNQQSFAITGCTNSCLLYTSRCV